MAWYEDYVEMCFVYVYLYGELFVFNLLCLFFAVTIPSRPGSPLLPFSSLASFLDDGEEDGCPVKDVKTTSHGSEHSGAISKHDSRLTSPLFPPFFDDDDDESSARDVANLSHVSDKSSSAHASGPSSPPPLSSFDDDDERLGHNIEGGQRNDHDSLSEAPGDEFPSSPGLVVLPQPSLPADGSPSENFHSFANSASSQPEEVSIAPNIASQPVPAIAHAGLLSSTGPLRPWMLLSADSFLGDLKTSKKYDPFNRFTRQVLADRKLHAVCYKDRPEPSAPGSHIATLMQTALPMILEALVEHVPGSNPSTWREGERGLVAMSQVSRELRSLIFGLPLLWSRVLNPDCQGLSFVMRVLELSKNAELHITFSHGHRGQRSKPEFADLVLSAFSRCKSIRVDRPDCWILDNQRPPSLRSITIDLRRADYVPHRTSTTTPSSPSVNHQLVHAPGPLTIASLSLNGYTEVVPTIASTVLTCLEIIEPFDNSAAFDQVDRSNLPKALDWLAVLRSFPNLQYVSLVNCINSRGSRGSIRQRHDARGVALPHLHTLTLLGDPEIYTFLLGQMLNGKGGGVDVEVHLSFEDADIPPDEEMARVLLEAFGYIPDEPEYLLWHLSLGVTMNIFSLIAHAPSAHQFALTFEPLRSLRHSQVKATDSRYMSIFMDFLSMAGMQNSSRMEKALQLCISPPSEAPDQNALLTATTPFFNSFQRLQTLSFYLKAAESEPMLQGFASPSLFPALRAISVPQWGSAEREDLDALVRFAQSRQECGHALSMIIFAPPWQQMVGSIETLYRPIKPWQRSLFALHGVTLMKAIV
ncbi:hypothetical protein NMY22_g10012 [Coprinellus aureogranulatus]|nr:hypothetical protein NMY22_g10012 [Coprinellus aureogranulatus]